MACCRFQGPDTGGLKKQLMVANSHSGGRNVARRRALLCEGTCPLYRSCAHAQVPITVIFCRHLTTNVQMAEVDPVTRRL